VFLIFSHGTFWPCSGVIGRAQFESGRRKGGNSKRRGSMKAETGEQRLQKPKLISTEPLLRAQSVWRFQRGCHAAHAPNNSSKNQPTSAQMAVAEVLVRPSTLKESLGLSWRLQERFGQVHGVVIDNGDDAADAEKEFECTGCRKISRDEGRRHDPINIGPAVYETGESVSSKSSHAFLPIPPSSPFHVSRSARIDHLERVSTSSKFAQRRDRSE